MRIQIFLKNSVCFSRFKDIQILVSSTSENLLQHKVTLKGPSSENRDIGKSKRARSFKVLESAQGAGNDVDQIRLKDRNKRYILFTIESIKKLKF